MPVLQRGNGVRPPAGEGCECTSEKLLVNLGQSVTGRSEEIGTYSVSGDQSVV